MASLDHDHFATERRRVKEAFEFFDREGRGLLVKEEIGTIMRYLGAFPSEEDIIKNILPQIQDDEEIDHVKYEKFERFMVKVMAEREYEPASEEVLLQAFKALDPKGSGYIPEETIVSMLTSNSEAFRDKEIEEFLRVSKDPETGMINYNEYVNLVISSLS